MYNRENNAKVWKLGSKWRLFLFWTVENIGNITTLPNPGNVDNVASYIQLEGMHRIARTCANKKNRNY